MQDKAQFETFLQSQGDESLAKRDIRKDAFNRFLEIGYPTKKHENWRFTNLTSLTKTEYQFSNGKTSKIDDAIIRKHSIDNSHRIVFIDGKFDAELSAIDDIAKRITIKNISESFNDLNRNYTKYDKNPFILLNKAFVTGGYLIEIQSNYIEDKPLHILNIISGEKAFVQHHQHNLIRIGKNSQVSIVEENININQTGIFRNTVYNIKIEENSTLSHILLQQNHAKSKELNHIFVEQQSSSTYNAQLINIGGDLIRNDINVLIDGENCSTDISG
ncbi:MAG: SufD family Fe-S cluster assembly protein, partial [Candidatus Marinimicrobia bacterium]|nr:SufD family Fe-S cluster assembly protein [Candidatus Neomarinimicrobiota bacterium]